MRKALVYGPCDLRLVELPERRPGTGEVRARMLVTSLTTANVRLYQGPLVADLRYPVTLSYTGTAEVVEVGPGVERLRPGDLVYPNFYRACGRCDMCRADRMVACREMPLGAHNMMVGEAYESGLQDDVVFPEERLRPVPPGAPVEAVAMTGFMSVAMNAVTTIAPRPWETVAITGAGPLGWCCTQICKLMGARVVICDIRPERMELARRFGADSVVDGNGADVARRMIEACGQPPLAVIEATGTEAGSALAFEIAGRGARLATIGVTNHAVSQHFLILKGLTVTGIGGAVKVGETIQLISEGRLDLTPAVTHRFPFSRLKEAFELKRAHPEAQLVAIYMDEARLAAREAAAAKEVPGGRP